MELCRLREYISAALADLFVLGAVCLVIFGVAELLRLATR